MTEKKRFKLLPNNKDAWDIIDYEESKKIDGHVIYNDLGSIYFSSAPQLCDLSNQLNDENKQLKKTNQELYDFRLVLNALLFNEWVETGKYEVYKSKRHHDGEPCFDGEWFIVVAILPSGQVTNHYHIKYWDYFKIPSYERVKDEFDGHTSSVVLLRYGVLLE